MKTSVNMIRKLNRFDVIQRTSDGKFNASELLRQWNKHTKSNKKIVEFTRLSQTKEFMEELLKDISQSDENHHADYEPVTVIKGRNTKKGKTPDTVWYHPYLFIKFAMWLNPRFELQVIKFVYDQLIEYRNEAGDGYNEICAAVQGFVNIDYRTMAKGLNWIVFGKHKKDLRQVASEKQLAEMVQLQKNLAFSIDMGYIRSFDELLNEMRKIYRYKYNNA